MASHHAIQDTPRDDAAKLDEARGNDRRSALRVVVVGLNIGFAMLLWPLDAMPPMDALGWGAGALLPLALGAVLVARARHAAASWLLLVAFPVLLALSFAMRRADSPDPLALVLMALSLLAYGAVAASVSGPTPSALPYAGSVRGTFIDGRSLAERLRWTLVCVAALAIVVVAPAWGGTEALHQAWGDAANEGAVLTAVVAASAGCAVMASYAIGVTRAPNKRSATNRRWRVALLLAATALGAVTYTLVR